MLVRNFTSLMNRKYCEINLGAPKVDAMSSTAICLNRLLFLFVLPFLFASYEHNCQRHPRHNLREPQSSKDQNAVTAKGFKEETRASGERGEIEK